METLPVVYHRELPLGRYNSSEVGAATKYLKPLRATPLPVPPTQSRTAKARRQPAGETADPPPKLKSFWTNHNIFHPEIHKRPKENSSIQRVRNGIFRVLLTIRPSRVTIGSRFEIPVAPPGTKGSSPEPWARNIGWTQEGLFRFARECKQTDVNIAATVLFTVICFFIRVRRNSEICFWAS